MKRLTFIPFVLIILALFIAVPTQAQILSDIDGMLTKVNFIAPQQFHSTTSYSDTIALTGFKNVVSFIFVVCNDTGTAGTLDIKLQQRAAANSGTAWADISSAAITQITTTTTRTGIATPSGTVVTLPLSVRNVYKYVRAVITTGGTTPYYHVGAVMVGQK